MEKKVFAVVSRFLLRSISHVILSIHEEVFLVSGVLRVFVGTFPIYSFIRSKKFLNVTLFSSILSRHNSSCEIPVTSMAIRVKDSRLNPTFSSWFLFSLHFLGQPSRMGFFFGGGGLCSGCRTWQSTRLYVCLCLCISLPTGVVSFSGFFSCLINRLVSLSDVWKGSV